MWPHASSEEDIPKSASPLGDRMLVPVFHRKPSMSAYRGAQWSLELWPSYIILTREEAKDHDTILKKLLARVAQMTTRPILTELSDSSLDQSRTGSDIVLTTEEDASPNGDPRVHDGSVEGEDMVEVTMTDTADAQANSPSEDEVPEVLKPGTFIPPAFRQLFEMKHTRAGKEMVPTGWSTIDASKIYEPLSKRVRVEQSRQSSTQSSFEDEDNVNASSSEEVDDTPQFSVDAQSSIEQANQSSEEEIPSIETESFSRDNRYNSKKNKRKNKKQNRKYGKGNKHPHTYSKKGKDRPVPDQPSPSDTETEEEEGLVRLGEGLVLDWTEEAYDALFGGKPDNSYDERGVDATKFIENLDDPELQAKKAKRAARKKNGITLEECFAETSKSEVLSEDNAWYCGRCKELRRATKTLEIWTAPDILVLHLKRFSAHRTFRDKVDAFVDCPIEGLDLSGKVGLPEEKGLVYDLFAVDNHYGGLGGGHYTACARNFYDGKWYDYNGTVPLDLSTLVLATR
jgi:ubiquitin carboxyl-terminal hydrolase 4/11